MDKLPGTFAYTQADLDRGLVLFAATDGGYYRPYSEKYNQRPPATLSVVIDDLAQVDSVTKDFGLSWRHSIMVVNPSANALLMQAGAVADAQAGNISGVLQRLAIAQIDPNGPLPKLEAAYAPAIDPFVSGAGTGVKSVKYDDGTVWTPSYPGEPAPPLSGQTVPAGVSGPIPPNPTLPTVSLPTVETLTGKALPAESTIKHDAASQGVAVSGTVQAPPIPVWAILGGIGLVLFFILRGK